MRVRLGGVACAVAAAIALPACGDGGGDRSSGPATLTPADVPVYFQARLRPEGEVKANAESLVQSISGQTAGALVDRLVEEANTSSTGKDISFQRDIDPWLGENAGVFVTNIAADSPDAAGLVETTDEDATQDFIDKARERGDQDRQYEGVDYLVDEDTAVGVVDGFLVIGNEPGFKQVVDVSGGQDALSGNDDFNDTIDGAPQGSLAEAYVALDPIVAAIEAQGDPQAGQAFRAFLGDTEGENVLASLVPRPDSIEVEERYDAALNLGLRPGDVSELIGSFPAQSFAALAVPDIGEVVSRALDQLESAGIPGVSREAIDQQLSGAGLSIDEITATLGDLGLFVEGTSEDTLEGALVTTLRDPEKAEDIVGTLSGLALASGEPGISKVTGGTGFQVSDPELGPKPGVVLVAGDRLAFGYGIKATQQALDTAGAEGRLADDPTYKGAAAALGDDVDLSAYVAVAPIIELAESLGARSDPDYVRAKPYLQRFTYLVTGSGTDGDTAITRAVVGVEK